VKLNRTIENAMPLLLRDRVIEAVLKTQNHFGSPVTAQEVRDHQAAPLLRHSRALTELCHQIVALGSDEDGRSLHCAGKNRERLLIWWVQEPKSKRVAKQAAAPVAAPPRKKRRAKAAKKKRARA
jgi:hypothetical protein